MKSSTLPRINSPAALPLDVVPQLAFRFFSHQKNAPTDGIAGFSPPSCKWGEKWGQEKRSREWLNYQKAGHLPGELPSFAFPFFGDGPQHTVLAAQSYDYPSQPWSPGSGRQIPDLNRANLILSCWNVKTEQARQRLNLQSKVTLVAGVHEEVIKLLLMRFLELLWLLLFKSHLFNLSFNFQYGLHKCLLSPLMLMSISLLQIKK